MEVPSCLDTEVPVTIFKLIRTPNGARAIACHSREAEYRYIAAACCNALATLASPSGLKALIGVAKDICKYTQDKSKFSAEMIMIDSDDTDAEASKWVSSFLSHIFEELPVIWIDEEADARKSYAFTSWDSDARDSGQFWGLGTSIHLNAWLIKQLCIAAGEDKDQFRNYLLRLKDTLCHEIGGHLLRYHLVGLQNARESTPDFVGAGLPYTNKAEAGHCLERHLLGGKGIDVISAVENTKRLQPMTPCLSSLTEEDDFTPVKEIPSALRDSILRQDFFATPSLYPYQLGQTIRKMSRQGIPYKPDSNWLPTLDFLTLRDAQPTVDTSNEIFVKTFRRNELRPFRVKVACNSVKRTPFHPETLLRDGHEATSPSDSRKDSGTEPERSSHRLLSGCEMLSGKPGILQEKAKENRKTRRKNEGKNQRKGDNNIKAMG